MAKNGHEMITVDSSGQDPASTGKTRIFGDDSTGYPAAIDAAGVILPWGAAAIVAPVAQTSDFSVDGTDNGAIYDCQGALTVTLEPGTAAGVRLDLQHTDANAVTKIQGGSGVTLVSDQGNADPLYFMQQGATLTLTAYQSDVWYLSVQDGAINTGDVPLLIENCQTWYPMDRSETTNGVVDDLDSVPDIIDQSGAGNDLNQPTGSSQAIINTNALNGMRALRSLGNARYALTASQLTWPSGNNTVFAVAWQPTEQNSQYVIGMDQNQDDWGIKANNGEFQFHNGGTVSEPSRDMTVPSVVIGRREGTSLEIYDGNTLRASNSSGANPAVSNGALFARGGSNQRWNGWIAEIIVYNRALEDAERETITNYLGGKWGVDI